MAIMNPSGNHPAFGVQKDRPRDPEVHSTTRRKKLWNWEALTAIFWVRPRHTLPVMVWKSAKPAFRNLEALGLRVFEGALTGRSPRNGKSGCSRHAGCHRAPDGSDGDTRAGLFRLESRWRDVDRYGRPGPCLARWWKQTGGWWRPAAHFFLYPKTLPAMVAKAGFTVKSVTAPWKIVPLGLPFYQVAEEPAYASGHWKHQQLWYPDQSVWYGTVIAVKP